MDRFLDYYFEDNTFMMPIDFDLLSINETGELEIGIPLKYLPQLVEYDVIRLSLNGKKFSSLTEAYEAYDSLIEEEKQEDKEDNKLKTKVKDPETGVERDFEVAAGNAKIGGNTVILNMSTAGHCMSAILGTCKLGPNGQCYALRFEKQWSDALKKNLRHEEQWSCLTPRGLAQGIAQISEAIPAIKYIRINEAGEIRNLPSNPEMLKNVPEEMKAKLANVDDVEKLRQLGEELKKLGSPLTLYTYTHRSDLDVGDLGPNVCVNGSGYMLDNAFVPLSLEEFNNVMDLVDKHELKEFNGVPVTRAVHCIGDCRVCNFCKKKEGKHIFLPIHGSGTPFQIELQRILTSVIETPDFVHLLTTEGNPKEKGEQAMLMVPEEHKKMFTRLVPFRQDRIDLFTNIIKSKADIEVLAAAIEKYVSSNKNGEVDIEISNKDSSDGLAKSVDALTGKFARELENAIAIGKQPAAKKWGALKNALDNAIAQAKKGEAPTITKSLAKQHAGIFGRLKKELGK